MDHNFKVYNQLWELGIGGVAMSKDCWYGKVDDKFSINLHDVSFKLMQS